MSATATAATSTPARTSYLNSLSAAVDAAEGAFYNVAAIATPADRPKLQQMMAALDHAKAAYYSAQSEALAHDSSFVVSEQAKLDQQVIAINAQIATLKDIAQWLALVSDLASLAGSVATAFA